jgi:7-carboxy-7-deazaguanine synthase
MFTIFVRLKMIPINTQSPEKKRQFDDGLSLDVHSLFYTIQGEGPFAGHPAVFIRLAGCNLQCPSCDTEYTDKRQIMEIEGLAALTLASFPVFGSKNKLVVITGGEPFRQNLSPLIVLLNAHEMHVQIETNGTLPLSPDFDCLGDDFTIVCSPKTGKVHYSLYPFIDAYKYVLSHDSMDMDGLPIRALNHTASPRVARPHNGFDGPIYLQPMDSKDEEQNAVNLLAVKRSCMQHGYLLQLQLHKIVGVD